MKIVLAIHHFPPRYSAGAEVYTLGLARWLIRHGHQVDVVCVESVDFDGPGTVEHQQDTYEGIPVWRLHLNYPRGGDSFRESYDNLALGAWFADFLQRVRPQIVHLNGGYLLSASIIAATKQQGLPLVVTLHDFWFVCPRITLLKPTGEVCRVPKDVSECAWCLATEKRRFRWPEQVSRGAAGALVRSLMVLPGAAQAMGIRPGAEEIAARRGRLMRALRQADVILAPSEFLRQIFVEQGVDPAKIVYSRYGLDNSPWIIPSEPRRGSPDTLRLAYVGQLAPHKGVHLLVQAFRRLQPCERRAQLKIYGGLTAFPDYTRSLQQMARGNPAIEFAGRFENRRVAEILNQTDAIVVPSIWYENSPVTIMEALTAGTPVVATNLGGMPELVQHNVNGLLFEAGDVADLTRQLERLLIEPDLVSALAAQARPVRLIDDEMEYINSLYERLLAM